MSKCSVWDINSYCGRKREKKKRLHFSICLVRKQSRWIISWSGAFSCFNQLESKWRWTCQRHTHTHTCTQTQAHTHAHTPVWSATGYYWLTCLNSASSKSHSKTFSILRSCESWMTRPSFFTDIPHVPHIHRDMFVAFLFVAWETMLACLLTFHTWFHPLNPKCSAWMGCLTSWVMDVRLIGITRARVGLYSARWL